MACISGWVGGAWDRWRGGWAAGGRLNPLLGLFGLAMSPRSATHQPKYAQRV